MALLNLVMKTSLLKHSGSRIRPFSPSPAKPPCLFKTYCSGSHFSKSPAPPTNPTGKWWKWLELTDFIVGKLVRYSGLAGCVLVGLVSYDAIKMKGPEKFCRDFYKASRDGLDVHLSADDMTELLRFHEASIIRNVRDDYSLLAADLKVIKQVFLLLGMQQAGDPSWIVARPIIIVTLGDPLIPTTSLAPSDDDAVPSDDDADDPTSLPTPTSRS